MDANKLFCFTDPMGKSRPDTYDYDAGARRPCQQGARQDCPASWSDSPANHYAYDAGGHAEGNGGSSYDCQDRQAAVVAHYEYDPFGRTTVASGPFADANPWRFSTKQLDQAWGLYYYGLRFYTPGLGRWPSRDPIGERGGANMYCAMRNDLIRRVDSLGLSADDKHTCCAQEDVNGVAEKTVKEYAPRAAKEDVEFCGLICCDKNGKAYASGTHPGFYIFTDYGKGVTGKGYGCDAFRVREDVHIKEGEGTPDPGPVTLSCGKDTYVGKWHVHPGGEGKPSPGDRSNPGPSPTCPNCGHGCYVGADGTPVCRY
jgi:RHS repeat-associated protein